MNCQEKQNIHYQEVPYKVSGNKQMSLPANCLLDDMKGIALVNLLIDDNSKLLNFAIVRITISDEEKENAIHYFDNNVYTFISTNKIELFRKNYYPIYIQNLYEHIEMNINNFKIEYDENIEREKINSLVVKLWIN